ncbi:hypothetical protein [Xenorhabdus szentirmaii]|uniref:Uncharacterized HTH-type transcriptional regulator ydfF n=1 Tax=Xenorhabdus szentirmaii DSM 16338 TaxID=1427518 RepID=W1J5H3_9GAMM
MSSLGINCDIRSSSRRKFARPCLDWSERYAHLGGFLGALLLEHFLEKKWAFRQLGRRELVLTESGKRVLQKKFGVVV